VSGYYSGEHGRRKDFSRGEVLDFSRGNQNIFPVVPTMVKFHFTNSKLREQPCFAKNLIGKHQISKSRGPSPPCTSFPTSMWVNVISYRDTPWPMDANLFETESYFLCIQLMWRATGLIHTSEKKYYNFIFDYVIIYKSNDILIYVKTLIMFMLFSEQSRGLPTRSVQATWCLRVPCWWPLSSLWSIFS